MFTTAEDRKIATHLAAGFAAVIDHGEDSHAVYLRLIQQDRTPEDAWLIELDSARIVPENRKRLEYPSTVSPEPLKASAATKVGNAEDLAKYYKLMDEVDQTIASKDPAFRTYLAESKGQMVGNGMMYIRQRRNEYWKGVASKLNVWLADPTLFTTCKLAGMGVTVPK